MPRASLPTGIAVGAAAIGATILAISIAAPSSTAEASAAPATVTTYAASPPAIRLGSAPRCTVLRYQLGAPAQDVDLKVADSRGREVWEAEHKTSGVAAGVIQRFTWCGQARHGLTVAPGTYVWLLEVQQAGTDVEARSAVRRITVKR